ncbi:helix-turn-helix transcriptional regulator [Roseisalinus antarcticus]|uniref:Anaerobic benzoate catabolism transcriptional regulator n=1 Tax=Roseisalinus antarcticus TaxID=254357 RepID=A0A1Y5RQ49_9RHOB|nr:helix-turn-helix transcriptional regulator [Roseisalinus antarcticus]SLN19829.1 anaerobic benzoate catabolism transcriptional regulator [Roseisalinus antarcticus]
MPQRQFTGSRIRERRLDRGLRQSDLAKRAGISPSYLNLIEHNRRRIAGKLLNEIARALQIDPQALSEGAESATVDALRRAAARPETRGAVPVDPELDRIEEFAGRFAGWAGLVAAQERRIDTLEARVRGLSDRLSHDPQLATSLHEVISAVTSIRSTSAILSGAEELDADWQRRFHRNIDNDAQRLAESSQALVRYLDTTSSDRAAPLSALEEADALFEPGNGHLARIEAEGADAIPAIVAESAALVSDAGRLVAAARLARYAADAAALPLAQFSALALVEAHDPLALVRASGAPLDRVLRRLKALPPELGHPVTGLVVADSAGVLTAMDAMAGVDLPRAGGTCPLWPVFEALGQPGRAIRVLVQLPGPQSAPLLAYAVALPKGAADYRAPVVLEATMLYLSAPAEGAAGQSPPEPIRPVGLACRICSRDACTARREPSILRAAAAPTAG